MPIRLSGMSSGLDTDAIVQALVSSYSTTKTNLEKAQTKLSWKQDAWKTLNTKVYSFYTGKLSAMRLSSSYSKKTSSVSNSTIAKVTASSGAVNGNQKLIVKQLASAGYLTGGVISATKDGEKASVTGSTKLSEITGMGDYANGGTLKVKATASGGTKTVSLTSDMTVNQFVAALKDAGLSANFDSGNQRIFINSKTSGLDGEFTLEGADGNGTGALKALGLLTSSEAKNNYSAVAGWTDADVVANAKSAYNSKIASYNKTIQSYLAGNSSLKNANETTLAYRKEYAEIYAAKLSYEDTYDADGKLVSQTATAASRAEAFKAVNEKIDALKNSDRKKELEDRKAAGEKLNDTETAELDEFNSRIAAAEKVAGDLGNDTLLVTRTRKETVNDDGSTTAVMEDNDIDKYIKGISSAIKTNEETIASNMEAIYNLHKEVDSSFDKTSFDADSATEDNALITVDFAEGDTLDAATAANSANKLASDLIASYKAQREEAKTKLAQYEEAQKKLMRVRHQQRIMNSLGLGVLPVLQL